MNTLADVFGCWFHHSRFHFLGCCGDKLENEVNRKIAVQYARSCSLIWKDFFSVEFDFSDELNLEFGFCVNEPIKGHMFGACKSTDATTYVLYINPNGYDEMLLYTGGRDRILYKIWTIAVHEMSHVFTDYFFDKIDHDDEFTAIQHLIHDYFWDQNNLLQKLFTYPCYKQECCGADDMACCVSRQFSEKLALQSKNRKESLGGLDIKTINLPYHLNLQVKKVYA